MIGAYRVQSMLGAGGMGEVYRAHDAKLGRDVAIKILPPAFTSDPNRLARFEREARMLAALNHPNICAIYGLEEADGARFLVLELVEGKTLADHARRARTAKAATRGLPLATALTIAQSDCRGPRGRPQEGHHPSRPQTREHQDHTGRRR